MSEQEAVWSRRDLRLHLRTLLHRRMSIRLTQDPGGLRTLRHRRAQSRWSLQLPAGLHVRAASEAAVAHATEAAAILSVNVVHPVEGSKADDLALPGNVQAFTDTPIYSRTNGYLKKWYFDIGAHVRKGDLLAEIETPEIDQQLDQSRAELERMQANADLAGVTSNRWQALLAKHAVSQQEADQTRANYIAAQAAVDASRANVRRLEQLQSYERIIAPFDGVITARNTDIGDLIDAGSGSNNPRELFHLDAINQLRVYVAVPEVYSDSIHDGDSATLTQDSNPGPKDSRHHRAQRQRYRPRPRALSTSRWMSTTPRACCVPEPMSSSTSICPRLGMPSRFHPTLCCSAPRAFASVSSAATASSLCRSPSATTSAIPWRSPPASQPLTK